MKNTMVVLAVLTFISCAIMTAIFTYYSDSIAIGVLSMLAVVSGIYIICQEVIKKVKKEFVE